MNQASKICWVEDLGLVPYLPACEWQQRLVQARKAGAIPDVLLLCEHPHVITLGRNGKRDNLRVNGRLLAQQNVEFHPTDRGGDITYHGPGQIVGYPILDLADHRRDVRWYVNQLEEIMIRAAADFGIQAKRDAAHRGVWVAAPSGDEKLAALGVHLSRWITSHGFAFNVSTDLRYFDWIVPCGIAGCRATSLEKLLGRAVRSEEVKPRLMAHFAEVFGSKLETVTVEELTRALPAQEESAAGKLVAAS
ncbi:MAG TPA: lipoyl(octanoyl) transferase LipB [Candidatus Limnocylindrales bacterium]|nr:lipoyl(octanoyl) transferase LipB [Candidatus Limnocylindrales bacterium]